MQIKTLADFKRLPVGTKLHLLSSSIDRHKFLGTTRAIIRKQGNAHILEGECYLDFPKAKDFSVSGEVIEIRHPFGFNSYTVC